MNTKTNQTYLNLTNLTILLTNLLMHFTKVYLNLNLYIQVNQFMPNFCIEQEYHKTALAASYRFVVRHVLNKLQLLTICTAQHTLLEVSDLII